jgi:type II secretory pathway component GspD/PulD (secretin)
VRKIRFKQDDAQPYMVTKVFELKHTQANDLTPFVYGAVKRYDHLSTVERLHYKFGNKQFLVVSTPPEMMPYVDDMVAKLDRPGKKDEWGSIIEGTGIYRYAYKPRYRSTEEMVTILQKGVKSGDGEVFRNSTSNMIYWKDSASDSKTVLTWVKNLDRPVPQIELSVKVYEIRESDLRDIGIDYLAWKNGPGLEIFSVGLDSFSLLSNEAILSETLQKTVDAFSNIGYAWGGFFTAPQFDASFIRVLQQSGNAKLAGNASLTVVNDYEGKFSVEFSPEYQNIVKDHKNDKLSVDTGNSAEFKLTIEKPVICFKDFPVTNKKEQTINYSLKDYESGDGSVIFNYNVSMNTVVERNNFGDELADVSNVSSDITLDLKTEKLLAVWTKENEVEQTVGIPFLCELPVLKYIFGTTTTIKSRNHYFVTVTGRLVHPEASLSKFAGRVIELAEMPEK